MIGKTLQEDLAHTHDCLTESERTKLHNATIIITGCAGFLGYYFLRFFKRYAEELNLKRIIALDNFMLGYPTWLDDFEEDKRFDIQKFDMIHDDIRSIEGADKADYVIHMASIASPVYYRQYPIETLDANVWGLRALLDFYCKKPIKGILFFSSSELYGNPDAKNVPTAEEYYGYVSATGPRSCYDEAKRFGETMCMLYSQKYEMPIGVARPFNNYGPGMRLNDKRVPADFAKAIKENRNIEILSNGSPTRTFCYIADAIAGYLKVLLYGRYDYFNIGIDKPEVSIAQLAEIYRAKGESVFGYTGKVVYAVPKEAAYLTNNPQRRCPNINKAKETLQYEPTILVEEGVYRFLKFLHESEAKEYWW